MPFATSDTVPSRFGLHSRVALALGHAAVDAEAQQQVTAFGSSVQDKTAVPQVDYVDQLIKECAKAWGDYTEHPFPKQLANDTANLNGFRHYMTQDALYLEHYYRLRTEAVAKSGTFDEIKKVAAKLSKSLDWVTSFRDDLTNKLGVPKNDVTGEAKSTALQNSILLHEKVLKEGDWLDIHIILLPCILGYGIIANKLFYDPETVRNTIYYPLWIQANLAGSSSKDYRKFINDSIGNLTPGAREKRWRGWLENFTKACGTEKAFFDLGIPSKNNTVPAYKIVEDGTYKIRTYRNNHSLVAKADTSVITVDKPTPTEELWALKNTQDGYIIESVAVKNNSLTVPVRDLTQPLYEVKVSGGQPKQPWPINPVVVYNEKGSHQAFQIFLPGRSEFVFDAGRNVKDPKVFVTNNCQTSSQLWLLELVKQA